MHHTTVTELICAHAELNYKYRECDGKLAVIKITETAHRTTKACSQQTLQTRLSFSLGVSTAVPPPARYVPRSRTTVDDEQ
jgi:hypothetical protein